MDRLAYGLAALVGIAATALGGYGMLGGVGTLRLAWLVPLGGLELTLDPLGGVFLAPIGLAPGPPSVFAVGPPPCGRGGCSAHLCFLPSAWPLRPPPQPMPFAIARG